MSRTRCLDCTRKHLSQAYVLLNEYADDPVEFEEHFWYAMGHLAEAADECKGLVLSHLIRAHRRRMQDDDEYWIDFKPLLRLANRYAFDEIGVEYDRNEFDSLMEEVKKPVQDYLFDCCDQDVTPSKKKTSKKKSTDK